MEFLEDLEEDPLSRRNVNIYAGKGLSYFFLSTPRSSYLEWFFFRSSPCFLLFGQGGLGLLLFAHFHLGLGPLANLITRRSEGFSNGIF